MAAWTATDTFDSYSNGDLNTQNGGTGWSGAWSGATSYDVQGTTTYSGAKAIQFVHAAGDQVIGRTLTTAADSGILSIRMRKETADNINTIVLHDGGQVDGVNNAISVGFGSSAAPAGSEGDIYIAGTTTVNLLTTYSLSTWYLIEIELDGANTRARGRVNSGSWSSYVTMSNSKAQVTDVVLAKGASGASTGDFYYDEIGGSISASASAAGSMMII